VGLASLKWKTYRSFLRTVGKASDGIALGFRYGFDSGEMLDYVYQDRASGRLLAGRAPDRIYLNAIGWRAIRERKSLLQKLLLQEIQDRWSSTKHVTVLDVAAGPGRYLVELCQQLLSQGQGPDRLAVICRDLDTKGLQLGQEHATRLGLTNIRYEQGDACDPESLAAVRPRPDIVVVSGLYELFVDPAPIQRSLQGIHRLLPPGGRVLITSQVHHPQLEMIANVLVNREGRLWVMVCRDVETTESWVRQAGFINVTSQTEPLGLFAITAAHKA